MIQLMFPGPPHLTIVIYCAPHAYSPVRGDGSPFSHVMSAFLDGSDQDRSDRFKVIPRVVEVRPCAREWSGSWSGLWKVLGLRLWVNSGGHPNACCVASAPSSMNSDPSSPLPLPFRRGAGW